MFAVGIATGWNSPSIPKLIAADSPIPLTMAEGSWLITIAVYGLLLTSYPAVLVCWRLGPRRTLLLCTAPFVAGWLCVLFATGVPALFVSRFFFGCAYGFTYTMVPVYLSEIAADRVRGSMLAMSTVLVKCGGLFCFAVAPFVSIRTMAAVALVPVALFGVSFACMPDSPYHLAARGRREQAEEVLQRLNGRTDVSAELDRIDQALREAEEDKQKSAASSQLAAFAQLLAPAQRRALHIGVATSLILPMCGSSAINDYSQLIFARINWQLSAVYASILLASVQLAASIVGNATIDRLGRRPLLLGSCATMAACTATVAGYFAAEQRLGWSGEQLASIGWLPVVALMVFQAAFSVGLEPVAVTLIGELFAKELKSLACAVCLVANTCADVAVGKLFQVVSDGWGSDVAFGALAAFAVAYLAFAVCAVPETKGRRLGDILEEMRK